MFGLYLLKDWYGNLHLMSASKIHKQVMEQSQNSNYDWIASATDLISVCEKKNFPKHFEIDIKIAILNCFSQLINCDNDSTRGKETDLNAVYHAYNSLYEIQEEKVIEARAKFLTAFLLKITLSRYTDSVKGKTYHEYSTEWRNKQFDELFSKTDINFISLKAKLEKEFQNSIAIATKTGIISKDDVKLQIINETDEGFNNICNESLKMRLYGFSGTFISAFFDTEEELMEYLKNRDTQFGNLCVIDYLGTVANRSDVIRVTYKDAESKLYTVVDENGYGIYNKERSISEGKDIWEYSYGSIREMYSAFRERGIIFEDDIYAKIDENKRKLHELLNGHRNGPVLTKKKENK